MNFWQWDWIVSVWVWSLWESRKRIKEGEWERKGKELRVTFLDQSSKLPTLCTLELLPARLAGHESLSASLQFVLSNSIRIFPPPRNLLRPELNLFSLSGSSADLEIYQSASISLLTSQHIFDSITCICTFPIYIESDAIRSFYDHHSDVWFWIVVSIRRGWDWRRRRARRLICILISLRLVCICRFPYRPRSRWLS